MHLVEVLRLGHHRHLSRETCDPQVVTLGRHEVRLQPDRLLAYSVLSRKGQQFALEVALEVEVDD